MKNLLYLLFIIFIFNTIHAQYLPKSISPEDMKKAAEWTEKTYQSLSQDEKLGQLFIVALYTNRGEDFIENVRKTVLEQKTGGLILMQDDAGREVDLVNEFQSRSRIPMLIGMDAEWGLYQRIPTAHKFPWAITLGAIQDKSLISRMSAKIAEDCKRMGINWDFAPVVDVNTNPGNPIIGNRSFGSEVPNVISSAMAYAYGLQDSGVLAAIKHFPGHGDTDTDSHLDLPVVSHSRERLEQTELAPFRALMNKGIGGVMVAHLYVPALEKEKGVPASVSKSIVTGLLKNQLEYKGLIITDALNMGAVANRYQPGELDAMAFEAGNDLMLFSQDVATGKKLIQKAIDEGKIPQSRVEESVRKILMTKYLLGLTERKNQNPNNINADLNTAEHQQIAENLYAHAITLIKDEQHLLPLRKKQTYYYIPLEEAPHETFRQALSSDLHIVTTAASEISTIPSKSVVIVGLHKDNSTAYKPYRISEQSKKILKKLSEKHSVILDIFGSPYAMKDISTANIPTVLISYENNDDSMKATARALKGGTEISGRLPVLVNDELKAGSGITLPAALSANK